MPFQGQDTTYQFYILKERSRPNTRYAGKVHSSFITKENAIRYTGDAGER